MKKKSEIKRKDVYVKYDKEYSYLYNKITGKLLFKCEGYECLRELWIIYHNGVTK